MNIFWKGAAVSKIVNISWKGATAFMLCEHFWEFVNIFWKGATVSKLVNILAVCEHILEGSYCFLRRVSL